MSIKQKNMIYLLFMAKYLSEYLNLYILNHGKKCDAGYL